MISKIPLSLSYSIYITADDPLEENAVFEAWVKEHKQTYDNKFDYILAVDVKEEALKDYIIGLGYEYKTKILNGVINKRGYKKLL